jgi:O-antigen/teichoic acid export membrane protein
LLDKPGWIAWIRGIGAAVNIILNFLLIPEYGIMGAAIATCLSLMLIAVIFYFINKQIFPISYNWNKLWVILITTGLIYFIHYNLKLNFSMKILVSISYPAIMIFTGVINMNQIRKIIAN